MKYYRSTVETLKSNIRQFIEDDNGYHIHLGMDRRVSESTGNGKVYLGIYCYTLNGRYKGKYMCGYVDMESGEYHIGTHDVVNAETMAWIGK